MSFTINLETEDNKVLESIDDNNLLNKYIPDINDSNFCCIKYIDLYGDTIFNKLQMSDLIKEIQMIENKNKSKEFEELIGEILKLAEACKSGVHLYLKFCGD